MAKALSLRLRLHYKAARVIGVRQQPKGSNMEIIIGVTASLVGVIVGGVLQYLTSQKALDRQHNWERSRLVQEKLEQIAEVASDVGRGLSSFYMGAIVSVESGKSYEVKEAIPYARLEMLLRFYAPEVIFELDRLNSLQESMEKIVVELVSGRIPTEKGEKQRLNGKLVTASFEASRICEAITEAVSDLGRQHLKLKVESSGMELID